jgi:hypothetical protein
MLAPRWLRETRTTLAGLAVGLTVGLLVLAGVADTEDAPQGTSAPRAATGSVPWLIDRHDCWTGSAPDDMAGKIPEHAVVTWPGHQHPTYGGRRAVGAALEAAFGEHPTPDLVVHAFCR